MSFGRRQFSILQRSNGNHNMERVFLDRHSLKIVY